MLIYFDGNSAFSLPNFMTYRASLWDTIRKAVKKSPAYYPIPISLPKFRQDVA
ncbi:MAG: hypothetical protein BECKG1743E_GA0114224_109951 [Candidatus Kentron sp. G]|nr:MAG: hypothetical protein BECKG1743E_GA0114224_109951 [Candidatus Kentron sp. G]